METLRIKPLNDRHKQEIGFALGLATALNHLNDRLAAFERLPGYNTAIAVIQEIEARHRAEVAGLNFRAAVVAGIDIRSHIIGLRGRGEIYAEAMDLVQAAEFSGELSPTPTGGTPNG